MFAYIVVGMYKVCALCANPSGEVYRITYELVGMMGFVPSKCILNQYFHSLENINFLVPY